MVCSALFLHRALNTVHSQIIMQSRHTSFVITPAICVNTVTPPPPLCSQWGSLRGYSIRVWRHDIVWDFDVTADADNGWGECIIPIESEIYMHGMFASIYVLVCVIFYYFIFHKNTERHRAHTIVSWPNSKQWHNHGSIFRFDDDNIKYR